MQLKVKALLHDIEQAIDLIDRFTSSRSFEDYTGDPMVRSAVERQLVIIGEALNQLTRLDPAIAAKSAIIGGSSVCATSLCTATPRSMIA